MRAYPSLEVRARARTETQASVSCAFWGLLVGVLGWFLLYAGGADSETM